MNPLCLWIIREQSYFFSRSFLYFGTYSLDNILFVSQSKLNVSEIPCTGSLHVSLVYLHGVVTFLVKITVVCLTYLWRHTFFAQNHICHLVLLFITAHCSGEIVFVCLSFVAWYYNFFGQYHICFFVTSEQCHNFLRQHHVHLFVIPAWPHHMKHKSLPSHISSSIRNLPCFVQIKGGVIAINVIRRLALPVGLIYLTPHTKEI